MYIGPALSLNRASQFVGHFKLKCPVLNSSRSMPAFCARTSHFPSTFALVMGRYEYLIISSGVDAARNHNGHPKKKKTQG